VGDPTDEATGMGPLISRQHLERVEGFVRRAESDGAKVVAGGGRPKNIAQGFYFEPTILTDATAESYIAQEEVFGPVMTVLRYREDADAIAIANNSSYGLGGAVWSTDVERALGVARRIRTGQISINGTIPGDAPFGGFKQSGIGREGGVMGLRSYMEPQAIGVPA
jgi:aldehyde dehydrogenase (NAD+)